MRDDAPKLDPEEASRLVALALVALLLVVPSLLRRAFERSLERDATVPALACRGEVHRTTTGSIACGGGGVALSESERWVLGLPIDLNRADADDLQLIPGMGAILTARTLAFRAQHGPLTSVDDLDAIPGIGPRLLAQLRAHATTAGDRVGVSPGREASARRAAARPRARSRSAKAVEGASRRRRSSMRDG